MPPSDVSPPFTVGPVTAGPGCVVSGMLTVPAGPTDSGTTIPISIAHGSAPGPVLALVAGVHGMEYAPIVALQRLRNRIDAAHLHGTVLMVHVANLPSFLGRTIYYSPVDAKNLNRVFPGRADGSISERIADALTREVIARATHVVDLHGGDGNESLRPYSYWITSGDPTVAEESRALALAFGLDRIVVDTDRPVDPAVSTYLSNTAITRGTPAITIESGCLGEVDEAAIDTIERGIAGVMHSLGMQTTGPAPVASPIWLTRHVVMRASATGIFRPAVSRGDHVAAGALIGRIAGFDTSLLEELRAPFAGEVLYVVATPPITAGEPIAMVAAAG